METHEQYLRLQDDVHLLNRLLDKTSESADRKDTYISLLCQVLNKMQPHVDLLMYENKDQKLSQDIESLQQLLKQALGLDKSDVIREIQKKKSQVKSH